MHYLGLRSVLKDMLNILDILKSNLVNCVGIDIKQLHSLLKINDKEYVLNLLTILENDNYVQIYELDNKFISIITLKGIEYLEKYLFKGGLLKINENKN